MGGKGVGSLLGKTSQSDQPAPGSSQGEAIKVLIHRITFALMPCSPGHLVLQFGFTPVSYNESADQRDFERFWSL